MAVNAFSLSIVILCKYSGFVGGRRYLDCVEMAIKVTRLDYCQFIGTFNDFFMVLSLDTFQDGTRH